MTINLLVPRILWVGSGATSSISLTADSQPLVFNAAAEIVVQELNVVSGDIATLTLGIDYTLSGYPVTVAGPAATLTRIAGNLATGYRWLTTRNTAAAQTVDIASGSDFSSSDVESIGDTCVVIAQEVLEKIDRAALISGFDRAAGVSPLLPAPVALGYLRWNLLKTAIESVTQVDLSGTTVSSYIATLLDDANAAAARATLAAVSTADVINAAHGGTGLTTSAASAALYAGLGAGFGTQADINSAATVDLGTAPSHNVQILGTTTITSFGASASTATPLYLVKFGGVLTVTHDATALVLPGLASYVTTAGDAMLVEFIGSGNWRVHAIMRRTHTTPTVQRLTSGSGTYTPTSVNVRHIKVTMRGGGGGGGAQATNDGANGGNTSFASWVANGGAGGGANPNDFGAGGTGGANGTGTIISRHDGQDGEPDLLFATGGNGTRGAGRGGGPGGGKATQASAGSNAKANTGSGGGGGSGGTGGGAGEDVSFYAAAVAASYTVGAGGAGGAAGTLAGGNGSAGEISIEEFYA